MDFEEHPSRTELSRPLVAVNAGIDPHRLVTLCCQHAGDEQLSVSLVIPVEDESRPWSESTAAAERLLHNAGSAPGRGGSPPRRGGNHRRSRPRARGARAVGWIRRTTDLRRRRTDVIGRAAARCPTCSRAWSGRAREPRPARSHRMAATRGRITHTLAKPLGASAAGGLAVPDSAAGHDIGTGGDPQAAKRPRCARPAVTA